MSAPRHPVDDQANASSDQQRRSAQSRAAVWALALGGLAVLVYVAYIVAMLGRGG